MPKSDKELAVEILKAYIAAKYSAHGAVLTGKDLRGVLRDAYDALRSLDASDSE